ncbi:hypothetical protein [Mesorhizobium sp. J8]|uniref:hypothetical protein n=1 Tax=Mesorhizobium sp. J8 TaxID=2777475 RepID=UPI001915AB0F|nr:hypothetical protein [Mesorhizobium sp. J8]BCM17831.1 hypothetical protein MJ8_15970 [Mesorhizobium sp. J8]
MRSIRSAWILIILGVMITSTPAVVFCAGREVLKITTAPKVLDALQLDAEAGSDRQEHVAPNGRTVTTIVRSDWADEEENGAFGLEAVLPAACTPVPRDNDGETFHGTSREVAKTRIAEAPIEEDNLTVKSYQASHPTDAEMQAGLISKKCDQVRVDAENRNVTVAAYLVAAKKEDDNDYHFILQDSGCIKPECRLTVEISGVPRLGQSEQKLKVTRAYFEQQWPLYSGHNEVPGSGRYLFFVTPVLVRVTGSAFYDSDHPVDLSSGTGPVGPEELKPGSAWEIHPVTNFEFDPRTELSLFALLNRLPASDSK